mmetsp:Transcript_50217/g.92770  ORF Transcript_50217/g.92770 Transcript_50217/m.92770 type:complete len:638 (+) Transcript_50217:22-1935(+)
MAGRGPGGTAATSKFSGWVFRNVETNILCDAAAIPADTQEHRSRLSKRGWGPRWARLCPVSYQKVSNPDVVQVLEQRTNARYTLSPSRILPWYEGLLLLDSMSRRGARTEWFRQIQPTFEKEKQDKKTLSSRLYVERALLNGAITGPKFEDGSGVVHEYRRKQLKVVEPTDAPDGPGPDADPKSGWFEVESFVDYLPAWEAYLHPRCGLYQEFYAVRWASPHNKTDFRATENGHEAALGVTWEPDECLPDSLDPLRVAAKRTWLEKQKQQDAGVVSIDVGPEENRAAPVKRPADGKHTDEPEKKPKYNPGKLEALFDDLIAPTLSHCWYHPPKEADPDKAERQIRSGWPKSADEYPAGYGACDPPGFCWDTCDCMEDWHLGKKMLPKVSSIPGQEEPDRDGKVESAFQAFQNLHQHVRRVSNKYLEPKRSSASNKSEMLVGASHLANIVTMVMHQCSQAIPCSALLAKEGAGLFRSLAPAFAGPDLPKGAVEPLGYILTDGPEWLQVESGSGSAIVDRAGMQNAKKGAPQKVQLTLLHMEGREDKMECVLDGTSDQDGQSSQTALTRQVVQSMSKIADPALRLSAEEMCLEIYNFSCDCCHTASVGTWVRVMSDLLCLARTAATAHVMCSTRRVPKN